MGWTQGDDNTFTYHMNRHIVHERVAPPLPGDDLFDEALEKFMFLSADNDGDGSITLKEFRHFIRRRVGVRRALALCCFSCFSKEIEKCRRSRWISFGTRVHVGFSRNSRKARPVERLGAPSALQPRQNM